MKKSPEEKLADLLIGNETVEERKDIARAVQEDDKEALMIYGLRKVVIEETKKINQSAKDASG